MPKEAVSSRSEEEKAISAAGNASCARKGETLADLPQIEETCDYWLNQWAKWCRIDDAKLGYPDRSVPFSTGGSTQRFSDFAEIEAEKAWMRNCMAMDALIEGLSAAQRQAVRQVYLGELVVFRFNRLADLLSQAADKLLIGMNERDIL